MVVAPANSEPVTVDFVLVVESTANMVAHWESLKKSYVFPAIQYFNGRAPSSVDYIGNHGNSSFSYVLFQAADQMPEPVTKCSSPTKSPWNFICSLDAIPFTGGGSERHSLVAEGLGKALELFDGLQRKRVGKKTKKICFLVCNSPPYDLPCYESFCYSGMSVDKLAERMGNNGIELSVISPQFIQPLRQLYLGANQNKTPAMNYAQDSRHLVYISGFPLPTERDPVKLNQSGNQPLQKQTTNASITTISSSSPSPIAQSPASSQSTLHSSGNSVNQSPGNLQQPNSMSHALSAMTDPATSTVGANTIKALSESLSTPGQMIGSPQTATVTAMSSAAVSMVQVNQQNFQSTVSQTNQQQHNLAALKNPFTSTNNMEQTSSSPLFINPTNCTINSGLNQASSGNMHIKNILMATSQNADEPKTAVNLPRGFEPQILLTSSSSYDGQPESNSIASVVGMSSMQSMIASSGSVLTNQQANMRQMPAQMTLPSQNTPASSVRSGSMQGLQFVSPSSGLTGETNSTPYNTSQQMTIENTANSTFSVSSGTTLPHMNSIQTANRGLTGVRNNILPYSNNPGMVNQSTGNTTATAEMMGLQSNPMQSGQMQHNQMQMNQQHINQSQQQQQQQQQQSNVIGNIGIQSSGSYMNTPASIGAGPVQTNNSVGTSSLQAAHSAAYDIVKQAEISANMSNVPGVNPTNLPGPRHPIPTTMVNTGANPVYQISHQNERVLWSGTLEWTEKRKPAARTTHALLCQVYLTPTQKDEGVNTAMWPQKLTMQLIPHAMFGQMQSEVKNNRTVSIRMSPPEHVQSLSNIMKNKWMGLVQIHLTGANTGEMKVLLVIYSQKKSQFFGLLPMDPMSFIARIRQIVSSHQNRSNAGSAHSMTGIATGMNVDANSNISQFNQDNGMKRVQQNPGQGQFIPQMNQISIRPNNQGGMHTINNTQNVGIRNVNMNQVVGGQVSHNNQRIMDQIPFRPNLQRIQGNAQLTNQTAMMNQQQQGVGQQMQQQGSNPNQSSQYLYSNMNQQRTLVGNKPGIGNVQSDQNEAYRHQQMRLRLQQQSQQQGQRNMQMNQVGGQGMTGNERQLRALLQTGQGLGNQNPRPRMQVINSGGIRQAQQGVMRPGYVQAQQIRRPLMPGNRMLGMQQSQQGFGGNMQQNQQQPPM